MMRETPVMIFPLPEEGAWGKAGEDVRDNRYEIEPGEHFVQTSRGEFPGARLIVGSIEAGREERYFVRNIGVVMRKVRSGAGLVTEELIGSRLMP